MSHHSPWFFSRRSCSTTACNRSAAASTFFLRSFSSAAAWDRFFCGRSSPAAAGSSLGSSAASLSSAVASPVALLSRTVVGVRPSSAVAGVTASRAHAAAAAAASAAAAQTADAGSFQGVLPPRSLRTPDEACHSAALLTAVAAASAPGPAAAVRQAPTSRGATRGWERLSSSSWMEGVSRSSLLCCSVRRLSFFACNPLSPLQKTEDMTTAMRSPVRVLTLAEGLREEEMPSAHSYSIKGAGHAIQPAVLGIATFATASNAASFDIFQRLKDPPDARQQDDAEAAATGKKRKPSDRVLRLVDEIMNLTLIEAADLCDLCQEKLAERSGGPAFSAAAPAGRTPFPHPAAMFAGMGMPGMMPTAMPAMGVAPPVTAVPAAGQPSAPQASPAGAQPAKTPEKKEEAKATFSIKLTGFDAAKKVAVVKEVRAITALGLRESKDLVEQAPKILKKGVPAADAEALKKKLEAAGAQVALE